MIHGVKTYVQHNRKYFEMNDGENTVYHNLWVEAKVILRGKLIDLNAYIRKEKQSKTNDLRLCFNVEIIKR